MKTIKTIFLFTSIMMLASLVTFAQEDKGNGYDEKVTVVGVYTPQLSEARKIGFTPQLKDTVVVVPQINYTIVSIPVETSYEVKPVPAAKMIGETFDKLYKNHIKAGIGNYWTPYVEFSHHSYRNKKLRGEIHFKHLSSSGKFDDYAYPGCSESQVGMSGNFIRDLYTFASGMNFTRDAIHYYGFMPDSLTPFYEDDQIKQVYRKLDFHLIGESHFLDKRRMHNSFALKYQGLWDDMEVNENNVFLSGKIKKNFDALPFVKQESFFTDVNTGFFMQNMGGKSISTGIAEIRPGLNAILDELELTVGVNLTAQLDSVGDVHFFPFGQLDIHLVPNALNVFIGVDGKFERNTFRGMTELNPFINTLGVIPDYMKTKSILYGGVSGGFGGKFNYRLQAKNRKIENMPLFINDTVPFVSDTSVIAVGNRFITVNDNVDILSLSMEVEMELFAKVQVKLAGFYHVFSPETQAKAWHMPRYEGNLGLVYNIGNTIYAKMNVLVFGDRYALVNNAEVKLNPIFDFNLGVEYRYSKFLSGFVTVNNFTTQRHYYWNNFPTQRLNAMIGVSYTF